MGTLCYDTKVIEYEGIKYLIGKSRYTNSSVLCGFANPEDKEKEISVKLPPCDIIGDSAFEGCKTKEFILHEGVININEKAFKDCINLKNFNFVSSVNIICESVFENSGLIHITVPKTVDMVAPRIFQNCKDLKTAEFFANSNTVPVGCFFGCKSLESIKLSKQTSISNEAFFKTGFKSLDFNDFPNIESIGPMSFCACSNLVDLIISKNIKIIDSNAFASCKKLKNAKIEPGVESMMFSIFTGTAIEELTLPESIVRASSSCEGMTNLKKATIKTKLNMLPCNFFMNCMNLEEVVFENNIKVFCQNAFYNTGIKFFKVPDTVQSVEHNCFCKCENLKELIFTNKGPVRFIESSIKDNKNLKTVIILSKEPSLGGLNFGNSPNLSSIILKKDAISKEYSFISKYNDLLKDLSIDEILTNHSYNEINKIEDVINEVGEMK